MINCRTESNGSQQDFVHIRRLRFYRMPSFEFDVRDPRSVIPPPPERRGRIGGKHASSQINDFMWHDFMWHHIVERCCGVMSWRDVVARTNKSSFSKARITLGLGSAPESDLSMLLHRAKYKARVILSLESPYVRDARRLYTHGANMRRLRPHEPTFTCCGFVCSCPGCASDTSTGTSLEVPKISWYHAVRGRYMAYERIRYQHEAR